MSQFPLNRFFFQMEIPSAVKERVKDAGQQHLLAYWSELSDQQRQILLHDINEIDFARVRKAYEGVKEELLAELQPKSHGTQNHCDTKETKQDNIDDIMEPVPDHVAGSINEASKEELESYRRRGWSLWLIITIATCFFFRFESCFRRCCICPLAGRWPRNPSWYDSVLWIICPHHCSLNQPLVETLFRCWLSEGNVRYWFTIEEVSLSDSSRTYPSIRAFSQWRIPDEKRHYFMVRENEMIGRRSTTLKSPFL